MSNNLTLNINDNKINIIAKANKRTINNGNPLSGNNLIKRQNKREKTNKAGILMREFSINVGLGL